MIRGVYTGSWLRPLMMIVGVVFLGVVGRSILSTLLLPIEADFGISHTIASRLFLYLSGGYSVAMLLSGFLSVKMSYRAVISAASLMMGLGCLLMAAAPSLVVLRAAMILFGAGLGIYLPSGIATITKLVPKMFWQKSLAIHEMGPQSAMIVAPVLATLILQWTSWRGVTLLLGGLLSMMALFFFYSGVGKDEHGQVPALSNILPLLKQPRFWLLILFFGLSLNSTDGIYLLIPTFLISEIGMPQVLANNIFGISRFFPVLMLLVSAPILDKIGARKTLFAALLSSGILVILLGIVKGKFLIPVVFLQPAVGAVFYPAGFALLSMISPEGSRNIAVSLVMPLAGLIGIGLLPSFLGYMGDYSSFSAGFLAIGAAITLSSFLVIAAKYPDS